MMVSHPVTQEQVRNFWEAHPLCADVIPFEPGSQQFFDAHTRLRDELEPEPLRRQVYEAERQRGRRLLDVGCGTGYVAALYAAAGARVVAIDLTYRGVALTRTRLVMLGLRGQVIQADAECMPFRSETFDTVSSFGVLHHTPDTPAAFHELRRVLCLGGRALVMLYHRNSISYRVLFPLKRLFQSEWRGKRPEDQVNAVDGRDNPLGKVFSRADMRGLLEGFDRVTFRSASLFFRLEDRLPRWLVGLLTRRWGWFLYAKATKRA